MNTWIRQRLRPVSGPPWPQNPHRERSNATFLSQNQAWMKHREYFAAYQCEKSQLLRAGCKSEKTALGCGHVAILGEPET